MKLPEGWEPKRLRDLATIRYGKGLPEKQRRGGPIPVYGANGIVGFHDVPLTSGPAIIIGRKGSAGAVNWSDTDCWPIDTTFFISEFSSDIKPKFLYFFLKSQRIEHLQKSAAIPGLSRDALYEVVVRVPPLSEQRRIVARLEALLGEVRAMRAEIRAMREDLERLMEAVLAELFPEYPGELPDGWRWMPISTIVQSTETRNPRHRANSSSQPQLPLFNSTGDTEEKKTFQYVEISSIDNKNYRIMLDKVRCIPNQDAPSRARKVIRKNDIIFATTRPYLKNIAIVPDELDDEICSTGFCVLRPIADKAEPKFVFYAVRANSFIKQLLPKQRGANYPAVTDSDVLGSYIPIPCSAGGKPSKEEQRRVATYLEFVEREIQAIRAILDEDERAVEELEQSILAAAFRGEV